MLNYKKLLAGLISLSMMISLFNVFTVNALTAPKFVVLQDFESISAADAIKGHEMFGGVSQFTAEISTEYKVDGTKSLKLSGSAGGWEYRFIKLDMTGINPADMSAIMMYFKTDDTCTQEGGTQIVAKFGVWTSDDNAYFSNDLGQIYDAQANQFIENDYSFGNKNTIWFSDARNREIAIKIPTTNMLKNPDAPAGQPDLDYSKITHVFMCTHEPALNKSLFIDRIVGIEGEDDDSLGFAPEVSLTGAPEVTPNLFMLQNFDSFAADADLLAPQAILSTPRKGSWKQDEANTPWYFDGTIGTAKASSTFKGLGGMSAKMEYPDGVLTWAQGESAFKAPVQQYGAVDGMSGAMIYIKMPSRPTDAVSDLGGLKLGFEGSKGADYLVFGLADGSYTKILNAGEDQWRYIEVQGNDIFLPYDWEGYVQIPYSYLTITYPASPPVASLKDSDFSPIIYGYVESVGGECGAFYVDDLMVYAPAYDTSSTAFMPSDWLSREGKIAGTINVPNASAISIEDILYDINNTDKQDIVISLDAPIEIPKAILAALQGKDKNLIMQVMDGETVLYSWSINGNDVTDISNDFEMNILINGSIFQDSITDLTKFIADDTMFISTVADTLPGKMTLSMFTAGKYVSKANVYRYDTDLEKIALIKEDAAVAEGFLSFELTMGGEYFISADTYALAEPVSSEEENENESPATGDNSVILYLGSIMILMLAGLVSLKKREFTKES
ncbi:MAG: LPXTG cell wall anchor domain-containing protein [Saccharofermentanales bacterium]